MMEPVVQFRDVEDCLAFIRSHTAELTTMTVELDEAEAAYVDKQATIYACTPHEFLSAVTMLHIQQRMMA